MSRPSSDRFPAGTFSPDPEPARPARMLAAQSRLELTLLLRNGASVLQGPVAAFSDNQALVDNYLG